MGAATSYERERAVVDPEQLYQEVLQEEQQKGSSGPVAEGRAKAARARAEVGSPHPKEPKWWPGSQPHLEDGAEPAAADEPPEEEVAESPEPAEQPAAAASADEPAPEPAEQPAAEAPVERPAAAASAEQPAAQQPAAQQPEAQQPAAQAPAAEPGAGDGVAVATRPTTVGVTHGTPSGNRLRPEDAVATEAQFEGQRAVYERRKLIDELIATGVPAVAASDTGRPRAPWLSVLYLLIPIVVIAFLVANGSSEPAAPEPPPADGGGGGGGVATDTLVAESTTFDADVLELQANKATNFTIENNDSALHNLVIFPTEEDATDPSSALFESPDAAAGSTQEFKIDPLKKGDYYFHCAYHANMNGTVQAI